MANKEYVFGFALKAAMDNHFMTTFAGASTTIMKLNERVKNYQLINEKAAAACKRHDISVKEYNNTLKQSYSAYEQLASKQKMFLSTQARINSAQLGLVKYGMNFMNAVAVWGKIKSIANAAIQFESAMADVRKVVDFDPGEKGKTQFKEMGNAILNLSTKIPMAAEGLAQIVAAGGQSGIARDDLLKFAESAAKMGVAFDVSADQAGEMMAKWRTAFKMNQEQVVVLADQINYLGNTTAASAPKISDVVTRIGPLGEIGGVSSAQIAALSASMVGAGVESEIAATGIKNMILALVSGESATKAQMAAFAELGMDAEQVATDMQTDAQATIMGVMKAIKGLDSVKQGSVMKELFGKESLAAISSVANNLGNLQDNFNKVADAEKYAGSMEGEFTARSATTANSLQLLENRSNKAKIAMSNGLLPVITPVSEQLGKMAEKIGEVATEYPGATTVIGTSIAVLAGATAAFSLLGGAIEGAKLAYHSIKLAVDAYKNAEIMKNVVLYAGATAAKIYTAAQWLVNTALYGCPVVWIIAGLAAIGVAAYVLMNNWDDILKWAKRTFGDTFDSIAQKFQALLDLLNTPISLTIRKVTEGISSNDAVISRAKELVEENATGGIYGKGAFLTTFAEDSGESAIPHTPNARNIGLLARTNEIMGNPLGGNNYNISIPITVNGSADSGAAQDMAARVEAAVRRALDDISNQQRRVSYV